MQQVENAMRVVSGGGGRTLVAAMSILVAACAPADDVAEGGVSIDFEKYELANGLDVILHVDRSDPIAAVAMTFHVGSSREVAGKTGFAHLFEHLFFLDSENLGPGGQRHRDTCRAGRRSASVGPRTLRSPRQSPRALPCKERARASGP